MGLSSPKPKKYVHLFLIKIFLYFRRELAKPEKEKIFIFLEMELCSLKDKKVSHIFSKKAPIFNFLY